MNNRSVISLNGVWECVKTSDTVIEMPKIYDNHIPVPGLWDLAEKDLGSFADSSLWYRKTIHLEKIPANVILRIGKASYGRYIYINGRFVEYYPYNYTVSETDITEYLKPDMDNEIVVRVQNREQQHRNPEAVGHTGFDGERKKYYPGIYDDVKLILNENPRIVSLQNAPDLQNGTVHIRAFLQNNSKEDIATPVKVQIYELGLVRDNGEPLEPVLVGEETIENIVVPAEENQSVDFEDVKLKDFEQSKYWSPENPYLYRIVVKTVGDTYVDRFGMRTFFFDGETAQAMINGEPRYIRGTNICLYRFFEDPKRKELPWNEEWVRELYDQFKKVNWESFRTHVCFLPEKWYELADEYGFLIFDEYPYWQRCEGCNCTTETMLPEVKNWMTERGMHASVIEWDIQNESGNSKVLTPIIQQLRSYDIQNRPWNNGWVAYDKKTDSAECHPYLYDRDDFMLSYLNVIDRQPWTLPKSNQEIAMIINETGWNWLNRDGSTTVLGKPWYDKNMAGSTAEERLEYYAESQAQLAEFWRSGGYVAGNLQFTGLSYSVPGRETSDILNEDITHPIINPYLTSMLRSAYAPLGIVIDNFDEQCWNGQVKEFPVTMLNGVNREYRSITVELILYDGEEVISKEILTYDIDKMGSASKKCTIVIPQQTEEKQLRLVARYIDENGNEIFSQRKLEVKYGEHGIAVGKKATASSMFEEEWYQKHYAQNMTDGSDATFWRAATDDKEPWAMIDLEKLLSISKVKLNWTSHYAKQYELELSNDGVKFETIYRGSATAEGEQFINVEGKGRYVKIRILESNGSAPGLYEFDVWGLN